MATEPLLAALDVAVVGHRNAARSSVLFDYWMLTKPEVNFLIAMTVTAAFCQGCPKPLIDFPWMLLLHTLFGTVLVASGAGTLNQVIERHFDAKMRRTARRPIATGRIEPVRALLFGTLLSVVGGLYLAVEARPAASLLALVTLSAYLFLYTPLKRRTPLCTIVGAFPGAMPVLIGFVAAAGTLDAQAWLLYAVLFLWQFPHFMAIAWMYRRDYARAGFLVLPTGGRIEWFVILQSFGISLLFLPLALLPPATSQVHLSCSVGILAASFLFSSYASRFAFQRSNVTARRLLIASIIYLPVILILMIPFRWVAHR